MVRQTNTKPHDFVSKWTLGDGHVYHGVRSNKKGEDGVLSA